MPILPYRITVTTPATSKDMTVLATVKAEMNITTVDAARDAFINVLIQQASGKAVELAGREFASETMTEKFRVDERRDSILQVSRRPVSSVTSIVEDGATLTSADYEIIASTGWLQRIDSDGNPQDWASSTPITVVYVAGWVMLTALPHALERIIIDEVKRNWFSRTRDPLLRGEDIPDVANLQYWIDRGSGANGSKDPMLLALEAAGFVDAVGI